MPTADPVTRGPRALARRLAGGALAGALAALLTAALVEGPGTGAAGTGGPAGPGSSGTATGPAQPSPSAVPLAAPAHSCLTWTEVDASDARQVSCDQLHLFEVTGTLDLAADYPPGAPFPGDEEWQELIADRCARTSSTALADRFDPYGRFSVGAIKPGPDGWATGGERIVRCGLQAVARSGAILPTTGSVANQDQSDVHRPGTCLGADGGGVGDPVDCSQPHAVEVVGVVDLTEAFPLGQPDEAAQDAVLEVECGRLAAEYAGGPEVVAEKGLTLFWAVLRPESWTAGSRLADCRLGAFLPDRSGFAPVTGSVQGPVTIGTEPAPEAPTTAGPASTLRPPVTEVVTPSSAPSTEPPG